MSRFPDLRLIAIVCVLTTLASGVDLRGQDSPEFDEEEIFSEVFGDLEERDSVIPVYRNGQFIGEVQARLLNGDVRVGGAAVESAVEQLLNADAREALGGIVGGEALLELEEFSAAGIQLTYRPDQIELDLSIAPESLRERVIGAERRDAPPNPHQPTDFSGYTNLLARGILSTEGDPNALVLGIEPVLNYQGWVLEGSVGFTSVPPTGEAIDEDPVSLRYARVVRDLPEQQLRGEVGIVRYQRGNLFRGPELLGVAATREDELDREIPLYRSADVRFVVPRYAPVEIYLNDRRYRREQLNEGPHRLMDLPLGRGTNLVRVEQGAETDADTDADSVILLEEQIPFSPRLLRPGRHAYSWGLGLLRDRYEVDALFLSGSHQMGVFPDWTAGADLQAGLEEYAAGLHSLLATRYGLTRADGALFAGLDGDLGTALDLSHLVALLYTRRWPVVEVSGRFESAGYRHVLTEATDGGRVRGGVSLHQRLAGNVNAALGVVYTYPTGSAREPDTVVRVAISHYSLRGYTINAQVMPTFTEGTVYWRAGVFIRFGSDEGRLNTSINYDLVQDRASLQVGNVPREAFDTVNWSAEYQRSSGVPEEPQAIGGVARYDTYHGSVQVQPEFRINQESDDEARLTTQFTTALAWAGPTVAVTRPIRDSFALFVPRPEVAGHPIPLRSGGGAVSAVLRGRAAVVPDLSSWRWTTVRLDGSQLPDGLSVGEREVSFFPGYRRGYYVVVGSASAVYVSGRLVDDEGEPIALEAGEIIHLDREETQTLFFTNREGAFEIPELEAGRYRLLLFAWPDIEIEFTISEGERGLFELGEVIVEREGNQ